MVQCLMEQYHQSVLNRQGVLEPSKIQNLDTRLINVLSNYERLHTSPDWKFTKEHKIGEDEARKQQALWDWLST